MNGYVGTLIKDELIWLPEKGVGYFPVDNQVVNYDNYYDEWVRRESTSIGKCLNEFRIELVNSYTNGLILDIGIGCGTFIKKRGNCVGYDICSKSSYLLQNSGLFFNPYSENKLWNKIEGITFFDSLEHIECPERLFKNIKSQYLFVIIPIFEDLSSLLHSKHFKKHEHYFYFTDKGLIGFMEYYGFEMLERREDEERCGREDIGAYVFKRPKEED